MSVAQQSDLAPDVTQSLFFSIQRRVHFLCVVRLRTASALHIARVAEVDRNGCLCSGSTPSRDLTGELCRQSSLSRQRCTAAEY